MTTISELKRDFYNFIKKKQNKYRIVRYIVQCHVRGIICVRRGCAAGTLAAGPPSHQYGSVTEKISIAAHQLVSSIQTSLTKVVNYYFSEYDKQ